jgi:hypothetical protein
MISRYFKGVSTSIKPKEAAEIHAAVLSILMGIFSAYSIYVYGEIRSKQQDVVNKTEEINQIHFIRSAYTPHDKDVFMATGPQDREGLISSLGELSILASQAKRWNDLKIPEDPAERAERFLEKLNVFRPTVSPLIIPLA